jgi:hypothetical protein
MDALPDDLIEVVACHVGDVRAVCRWLATCTRLAEVRERACKRLAFQVWGAEFWARARERDTRLSKPCPTWHAELRRIEQFQQFMDRHGLPRWTRREFYQYWSAERGVECQ